MWLSDGGGHRVANVDDGDGLGEDGAEEVGAAEVDQQQVVVALEELLLIPNGGDDHDVAEDAHQGQHHVHRHYEATLHSTHILVMNTTLHCSVKQSSLGAAQCSDLI